MATTIVTKHSVTPAAEPLVGDLTQGELAINAVDGRMWTRDNASNVVEIAAAGSVGTLTAGDGLTGGGDMASNQTVQVVGGTGITANADDVQINLTYADTRWGTKASANTWAAAQTFEAGVTFEAEIVETTGTMPSGTTPSMDPANGTIQEWTLTGDSTPTDGLADGEYLTLHIDDGTSAYTIIWTNVDEWIGGAVPTLSLTETNVIELWKVGTILYAASVGVAESA